MKILLVEDHPSLASMVQEELCKSGFVMDVATTGKEAIAMLKLNPYDALILDLGLPDMDGMVVLRKHIAMQFSDVPCLVLTARDSLESRLDALNAGADDYILKPFDMPELEARLRAVLRRPGHRRQTVLNFGNLSFDTVNRMASTPHDALNLPRREAMLLETLIQSAPRVVVKDYLEKILYNLDEIVSSNAVEALISRTRRKLNALDASCKIETLRGIGYRLTE